MSNAVAIITRTKNRNLLLRRVVENVLSQNYSNWVHVIVNDGGDLSGVENVLDPYHERYAGRLILVSHPESLGMEAASNSGIRASNSDYVVILDDDDTLEPSFLSETVSYLLSTLPSSIAGVVTLTNKVDEIIEGESIRQLSKQSFNSLTTIISLADLAHGNQFTNNSFLFKRNVIEEIGFFDESLPVLGDWDFNLRFIAKYDIGVIAKPLANYHHRPDIMGGDMGNTQYVASQMHIFYNKLLRNKYLRSTEYHNIGFIMYQYSIIKPHLHTIIKNHLTKKINRFFRKNL